MMWGQTVNTEVDKSLPIKIRGDSYSFDNAETKCDNQITLSPTNKGEGVKLKHYVRNKK